MRSLSSLVALILVPFVAAQDAPRAPQKLANPTGQINPLNGQLEPPLTEQKKEAKRKQFESRARNLLETMQAGSSTGERLEAILASLHFSGNAQDGFALMQRLARLQWPPGDLTKVIEEASKTWLTTPSPSGKKFIATGQQYLATGKEFPFNWRANREFWMALTVAMARSQAGDVEDIWKEFLVDRNDPNEQLMARMGYLAAVAHTTTSLDREMVKPLYLSTKSPLIAVQRLAEIHAVARGKSQAKDEGIILILIWDRLPKLGKLHHYNQGHIQLITALGRHVGRPLIPLLVKQASPQLFSIFCDRSGLSHNEKASQFLAKPTTVKFKRVAIRQAVMNMLDEVDLAVWVDSDVLTNTKFVDLEFSGVWKDAMTAMGAPLGYGFRELSDGIFYFGPMNKLKLTMPMLMRSRRKLPIEGSPAQWRAVHALRDDVSTELIDVPWHDALQLTADVSAMTIQYDGVPNPTVTSLSRNLPPHLLLTILCYETDCQWTLTKEGVIKVTVDPNPPRPGDEKERAEAEAQ